MKMISTAVVIVQDGESYSMSTEDSFLQDVQCNDSNQSVDTGSHIPAICSRHGQYSNESQPRATQRQSSGGALY